MNLQNDLRMINGNKEDNTFQGCLYLIVLVVLIIALSVTATAIYLALKNWG